MDHSFGEIIVDLMDNLKTIVFKDLVTMFGQMVDNMKEFGKVIKCMVRVSFYGLIKENTKANMSWIKNKDMVFSLGQIVDAIK